jgi:hypothetical protein
MGVAGASKAIPNMKPDSVVQECILVRPGMRRPPSEGHLLPIPREFFGYATHDFFAKASQGGERRHAPALGLAQPSSTLGSVGALSLVANFNGIGRF